MNFMIRLTIFAAAWSKVATLTNHVQCYNTDQATGQTKRMYTIALGNEWGAFEYINEGGYAAGFHHELISEVCAAASIDCKTTWEPYSNCVKSTSGQDPRPGVGLMDRWYDACIGWAVTTTRMAFFKFSESFVKPTKAAFFVKIEGSNFNPDKWWEAKKIGFGDGWKNDEKCLARVFGKTLRTDQIVNYASLTEIKDALIDDEVDAALLSEDDMNIYISVKNPSFKRIGPDFTCTVGGNSVMARKDSDFITKWNEGFSKLVSSGRFAKLCAEANSMHNADGKSIIDCV